VRRITILFFIAFLACSALSSALDRNDSAAASDPFIELMKGIVNGEISIVTDDWIDVKGRYMALYIPPEFAVSFTFDETSETADLFLEGISVGKILVGEFYETSSYTGNIFDEIVEEYRMIFNADNYEIADSLSIQRDKDSMNLYLINFIGQRCWIALYSESPDIDVFGYGKYFVFVGLPEEERLDQLANFFGGILTTLSF